MMNGSGLNGDWWQCQLYCNPICIGSEVRHDSARDMYMKENIPGKYLRICDASVVGFSENMPDRVRLTCEEVFGVMRRAACVTGSIGLHQELFHRLPSVDAENIWILLVGNQLGIWIYCRLLLLALLSKCIGI